MLLIYNVSLTKYMGLDLYVGKVTTQSGTVLKEITGWSEYMVKQAIIKEAYKLKLKLF